MPGIFNNPIKADNTFIEGTVITVDAIRFTCQVKTALGQLLGNVTWLMPVGGSSRSGDHHTPKFGDRVLITYSTGYPVIIGAISRPDDGSESFPVPIDSGQAPSDTGSYTNVNKDIIANPSKPQDLHIGDNIKTSEGGGLFGLLRGGSFIARASKLAQIFISKYDDLVRVVARSWELFSDVCIDVCASVRGQIYRYTGYGSNPSDSRKGKFIYEEYYGNTAAGDQLKADYVSAASAPSYDGTIRKYKVIDPANPTATPKMLENLLDTGELKRTIGASIVDQTPTQTVITVGASVVTVTAGKITMVNGGSTLTVQDSNITAVNGDATLTVQSGNSSLAAGGHAVNVTSGGVSFT